MAVAFRHCFLFVACAAAALLFLNLDGVAGCGDVTADEPESWKTFEGEPLRKETDGGRRRVMVLN